jgi:hypothetical protein
MKRYVLVKGIQGVLVGHPDARLGSPSYICQVRKPMKEGAMKGFGEPGYDGPELKDCYEPTMGIFELTQDNQKHLRKAAASGSLDVSPALMYPSLAAAEKDRDKFIDALLEAKQKALKAKQAEERKRAERAEPDPAAAREAEARRLAEAKRMAEIDALNAALAGEAPDSGPNEAPPAIESIEEVPIPERTVEEGE